MRSMAFRSRESIGETQFFQRRLAFGGMFGIVLFSSTCRRMAWLSYPLSPCRMRAAGICFSTAEPAVQSATWPPVSRNAMGRQSRSVSAWILVVRLSRDRPMAWYDASQG